MTTLALLLLLALVVALVAAKTAQGRGADEGLSALASVG